MAILTQFPTTLSIIGDIITVTEPGVTPTMPTSALVQVKIGLTETLEKNLNIVVDDILQYEGCYYNGELVPSCNPP